MFYTFNQNNSGGRFHAIHKRGISHYVVVEGRDCDDIIARAKTIGLYFNGADEGYDCNCCGDRWYEPWEGSSGFAEVPTIYGVDVSSGVYLDASEYDTKWIKDGPEGYIHYMNGTVQPVVYQKALATK